MNQNEIISAAPEILAHAMGAQGRTPHPLAERLRNEPLTSVARAFASKTRLIDGLPDNAILAAGLGTSDFQQALGDSAMPVIGKRFTDGARHRAFCQIVPVGDFREHELTAADDAFDLLEVTNDLAEIRSRPVTLAAGGGAHKLRTFARIVEISRQLIRNDQAGLIANLLAAVGNAAARVEARIVYERLETNPTLDDNGVTFHLDFGNILAAAFDAAQFGAAVEMLAKQTDSEGNVGDIAPRHLVVAAGLATAAGKVLRDHGFDQSVSLTSTALLPAGRWYLMADPAAQPVVGILTLENSRGVRLTPRRKSLHDSIAYRATLDTEAAFLGRVGVVKGGV